jgi:hypothetical protein
MVLPLSNQMLVGWGTQMGRTDRWTMTDGGTREEPGGGLKTPLLWAPSEAARQGRSMWQGTHLMNQEAKPEKE